MSDLTDREHTGFESSKPLDYAYETFRLYLDTVYTERQSNPIIPLSLGYPLSKVFPLPKEILEILSPIGKDGEEKARPGYGWEAGSLPLREAVIAYENTRHGTNYSLENVSMVAGGSYGLSRIIEYIFRFLSKYDGKNELVVVAPTFFRMVNRSSEHAKVKICLQSSSTDFLPTLESLKKSLSSNTKAVFICNPSNPGYNYLSLGELEEMVTYLKERKIYLILDEVGDNFFREKWFRYNKFIQSPNVIRICSASKSYQLAEYRIGYIIADKSFIGTKKQGFIKLIGDDMGNPPLAGNDAWAKMLCYETEWIENNRSRNYRNDYEKTTVENEQRIQEKSNIVIDFLRKSPFVTDIIVPDSSFNISFQFRSKQIVSDVEFFQKLLKRKHVSLVPCSGFGLSQTDCYLRLTYAVPNDILVEGMKRIIKFLEEINQ